ncbi:MAG TPA: ADP-forming succinate--CoA ligase subunit beta [Actinomycetota bacterium]|nr:ADP-forming succinate--CoA ligase subunit beta [Actinomycetota bacterium]
MDLYEHQGKELFARHGVVVPEGRVARTPEEAREAAAALGRRVAVKAQVQLGGRGKGGGIALVESPEEAAAAAGRILGGGFKGEPVTRVLVERMVEVADELYAAITLDRTTRRYLAMVSSEGGVEVEEVARSHPGAIRRAPVDPLLGLRDYQVRYLTGHLPQATREAVGEVLRRLWEVLVEADATLVEVNPLAVLGDGSVVALDAKVTVDDNALFRQPALAALRSEFPVDPTQARANELGLQYVKLQGEVGIIGNGAGLVMSTLDLVAQAGGRPANFLDVGGGAGAEVMAASLEVVLSDPSVRAVLVNIFGGITRCDLVARGILEALERVEARVPIVVRLDGTNAEEGRRILEEAAHPRIVPAPTMLEAARRAVELAGAASAGDERTADEASGATLPSAERSR